MNNNNNRNEEKEQFEEDAEINHAIVEKHQEEISKWLESWDSLQVEESGWTCKVYRVTQSQTATTWIFRFPRNPESAKNLARERWLVPLLRKWIKITIPDFKYSSDEMVAYPMIQGVPLRPSAFKKLKIDQKTQLAKSLAQFLCELHGCSANFENDDRLNALPEYDLAHSQENFRDTMIPTVVRCIGPQSKAALNLQKYFAEFFRTHNPSQKFDGLAHCDLSSDHILYDPKTGRLAGIIDFGDTGYADLAIDFCCLVDEYGKEFCQQVLDFYPKLRDPCDFWLRIEYHRLKAHVYGVYWGLKLGRSEFQDELKRLISIFENLY